MRLYEDETDHVRAKSRLQQKSAPRGGSALRAGVPAQALDEFLQAATFVPGEAQGRGVQGVPTRSDGLACCPHPATPRPGPCPVSFREDELETVLAQMTQLDGGVPWLSERGPWLSEHDGRAPPRPPALRHGSQRSLKELPNARPRPDRLVSPSALLKTSGAVGLRLEEETATSPPLSPERIDASSALERLTLRQVCGQGVRLAGGRAWSRLVARCSLFVATHSAYLLYALTGAASNIARAAVHPPQMSKRSLRRRKRQHPSPRGRAQPVGQ